LKNGDKIVLYQCYNSEVSLVCFIFAWHFWSCKKWLCWSTYTFKFYYFHYTNDVSMMFLE